MTKIKILVAINEWEEVQCIVSLGIKILKSPLWVAGRLVLSAHSGIKMMGMPTRGGHPSTQLSWSLTAVLFVHSAGLVRGSSGGEEQTAGSLQLPATVRLYIYFANTEGVIQEPDVFSGVLFFVFLFFSLWCGSNNFHKGWRQCRQKQSDGNGGLVGLAWFW